MSGSVSTRALAARVAEEARVVAGKLDVGGIELQLALEDLERSALDFSQTSESLVGFNRTDFDQFNEMTDNDRLAQIAEEFDVGNVLIAAAIATSEVDVDSPPHLLMSSAERLDDELTAGASASELSLGFEPADAQTGGGNSAEALIQKTSETIDSILAESLSVLDEAWARLKNLPPNTVREVAGDIAATIGDVPQIGNLLRLGMQALRRALAAIVEFVPESLRAQANAIAGDWWAKYGTDVRHGVVATLTSATQARSFVIGTEVASLHGERIESAMRSVSALSERFGQLAALLRRIVRALAAAVGVAALLVALPALATWVALASAAGYLAVAGSVLVAARDFLDTGGLIRRVDGVQRALASAVAP